MILTKRILLILLLLSAGASLGAQTAEDCSKPDDLIQRVQAGDLVDFSQCPEEDQEALGKAWGALLQKTPPGSVEARRLTARLQATQDAFKSKNLADAYIKFYQALLMSIDDQKLTEAANNQQRFQRLNPLIDRWSQESPIISEPSSSGPTPQGPQNPAPTGGNPVVQTPTTPSQGQESAGIGAAAMTLLVIILILLAVLVVLVFMALLPQRQSFINQIRSQLKELQEKQATALASQEFLDRRLGKRKQELEELRKLIEEREATDKTTDQTTEIEPPAWQERLTAIDQKLKSLSDEVQSNDTSRREEISSLNTQIGRLRLDVNDLRNRIPDPRKPEPEPAPNNDGLEIEILKTGWQLSTEHRKVIDRVQADNNDWKGLLEDLKKAAGDDVELKPALDSALAPFKEFNSLASKFSSVRTLVEPSSGNGPIDIKKLFLAREGTTLLALLQNNLLSDRLGFRLDKWITERFQHFADLFLQKYQQAQLDHREGSLEEARGVVLRILKLADLEPVDIVLGRTLFDSARHVGRSAANDPRLPNGTIAAVVRNGFRRGSGETVRQPEVIVNRL